MAERKGIMLAKKFDQAKFDKMNKSALVQPKLNGNRCRALIGEEGNVKLLSSSEAEIVSMPHIVEQIKKLPIRGIELDGELYHHGWSHQRINGIVRRTVTYASEHKQIGYYIFDIVDLKLTQVSRMVGLRQIDGLIKAHQLTHVHALETYFVKDVSQVMFWLTEFMEKGYEGIIVRDPQALYMRKRTSTLLKLKPMKYDTFKIIGYKREFSKVCIICQQTPGKCTCPEVGDLVDIPLEMLGAVECKALSGKAFYVGSGKYLTRARRISLWNDRESLAGKTALVKYQELSDDKIPKCGVLEDISGGSTGVN